MKRTYIARGFAAVFGSLLLIAGAAAGLRYSADLRAANSRLASMAPRLYQTACGPIEAVVVGQGAPVLVIHGNGGGFDQGLGLGSLYLEQGFQVIAPSRFGYLGSPIPPEATPSDQADTFACLLDTLGIERVSVFATSAGVTSAVQLSLRHPERVTAMVLHSPNAPGEVGLKPPPQKVFSAMVHSDLAWWTMSTFFEPAMHSLVGVPKGFALTEALQADVRSAIRSCLPIRPRGDGVVFDTYVSNPALNDYPLAKVQAPTLVVSAVDDPMALHSGARLLAERIPGARLAPIADGGHLMLGRTAEARSLVSQFLREKIALAGE